MPILYARLMQLIGELATLGLIHGDFNEFNLMLTRDKDLRPTPIIIDFPQMVSIDHQQGRFYFDRDVECVRVFFEKRFGFGNEDGAIEEPSWEAVLEKSKADGQRRLDVELRASGFIKPRRMGVEVADGAETFISEYECSEYETEEFERETDESECETEESNEQ